jgi:uncharacterized membrane protein YsdA (DUF1294 family)/cold shock CspA family protein
MRKKGKVARWNDDKGYGFIKPMDGGPQVFIHIKAFANRGQRPAIGDTVTYSTAIDSQGRLRAEKATRAVDKDRNPRKRRGSASAAGVGLAFFALIGTSTLLTTLPPAILAAYTVMSVVTYVAYAIDKSAAQSGRWRTSEGTLHLFALLGGWPGALIAQQSLRHKSRKVSFRVVFWATVILNCSALAWLHTEDGRRMLDQFIALNHASVGETTLVHLKA